MILVASLSVLQDLGCQLFVEFDDSLTRRAHWRGDVEPFIVFDKGVHLVDLGHNFIYLLRVGVVTQRAAGSPHT